MKFKITKLITTICLTIIFIMVPSGIVAESSGKVSEPVLTIEMDAASYNKREVVYANLKTNGNVQDVYVVNHFEITQTGNITDYGNYSSVTNLTSTDPLISTKGSISFKAGENNFYYQGNMVKNNLPWNFDISYYLDGVEITSQELAGKSGEVEVRIVTSRNEEVNSVFYENYILQITITLDAEKCSNIKSPGATIADSGSDTIIVNTVMPDKDGNITVSTKAHDFTMEAIEISAIPLTMEIETPDTGEMTEDMTSLTDAISDLNDGVKELNDGVFDMSEGAKELADGSAEFNHGLWYLSNNSGQLIEASGKIDKALEEIVDSLEDSSSRIDLDDFSKLPDGLDQLAQGLTDISVGLTQVKDGFITANNVLDSVISGIQYIPPADIESLSIALETAGLDENQKNTFEELLAVYTTAQTVKGIYYGPNGNDGIKAAFDSGVLGIETMIGSIDIISQTLSGISIEIKSSLSDLNFEDQMQQLVDGMTILSENYGKFHSGLREYTDGVDELSSNYLELHNGFVSLSDGIVDLYEGTSELYKGTSELNDSVADLPETIESEIDNFMKEYDKSNFKPVSFVSENNKNVSFVQFVFKTAKIELLEETGTDETETEDVTIWRKILSLFRL